MAERKFTRSREDVRKIRESVTKELQEREKALPPMVRDTGGSISGLKINTPVFQKWVKDIQEKVNPLIGKHVEDAPEYTINPLILDQSLEDITKELKEKLVKGASEYDSTNSDTDISPEAEDLDNAPKINSNKDKKFIDINIIENETRRMPHKTNDEILKKCEERMGAYHDDKDYKTDMPIDKIISKYKDILIAKAEEQKLLENKNNQDDVKDKNNSTMSSDDNSENGSKNDPENI